MSLRGQKDIRKGKGKKRDDGVDEGGEPTAEIAYPTPDDSEDLEVPPRAISVAAGLSEGIYKVLESDNGAIVETLRSILNCTRLINVVDRSEYLTRLYPIDKGSE